MTKPHVYEAIAAVQGEMAAVGISKGRRNQQQGYAFRGIDDVYAALSPVLAKHGLCIIPRVIERIEVERKTAKGGLALYVTVHAEFDFVSTADGSKHTAATYGEAMDTADKATNKAMSAAYKYAAFMTFAIPTEGDNDADAHTHDVVPNGQGQSQNGAVSPTPQAVTDAINIINAATTLAALQSTWAALNKELQRVVTVIAAKDARKTALSQPLLDDDIPDFGEAA